jgi:O-antigen/teichoic acid export membrane protein
LGPELYGVWITLTSILAYLTIFDLGIGSTSINTVAESLAKQRFLEARQKINIAYFTLAGIAILLALGVLLCWHAFSWPVILGDQNPKTRSEINAAAATAIFIVLANFPLAITPRILGACRKVPVSNFWTSLGSITSLAAIIVAIKLRLGLPWLVVAVSGSTLLAGTLSTAWLYHHFEWLKLSLRDIDFRKIRDLLSIGLPFFIVQVSGIILFETDNLIIAQVMGARSVTPYSVTWKLFSYASLLQVVSLPTLWPAYADAFARLDYLWIQKAYRYNLLIAVGTTTAFSLAFCSFGRSFIRIWAGPSAVPGFALILGMGVWAVISSLSWCETCLLGAAGRVKGQAIYSAIGAVVNVIASITLGRIYGLTGIISGTLIAYSLCIIIPQTLEVNFVLKRKPRPEGQA